MVSVISANLLTKNHTVKDNFVKLASSAKPMFLQIMYRKEQPLIYRLSLEQLLATAHSSFLVSAVNW